MAEHIGFMLKPTNQKQPLCFDELNVKVHFALPYNAQTKPIERDFLKIKELLSKHCVGYRGGNVVERPENSQKKSKPVKLYRLTILKLYLINSLLMFLINDHLKVKPQRLMP